MIKEILVDQDMCIGCVLCITNVPEVFRFNEYDKAEVFNPYGASEDTIQENAIDICPVACINWQE